jgi:hypothetical protein
MWLIYVSVDGNHDIFCSHDLLYRKSQRSLGVTEPHRKDQEISADLERRNV